MELEHGKTYITRDSNMVIKVKQTRDLFTEYFKPEAIGLPGLLWDTEGKYLHPFPGYDHLDLIMEHKL
jgi:hypothetical protein